jgi:hypothetical protein
MASGHDEFDTLPAKLVAELKRLDREALSQAGAVPAEVDEAVRASAVAHFAGDAIEADAGVHMFPTWARWVGRWAAAAMITLGVGLWWVGRESLEPAPQNRAVAITDDVADPITSGDVDGDGRRNIVDAMVLARTVAEQHETQAKWDYNADGGVDAKDVDALAIQVVALSEKIAANARDATQRVMPRRWLAGDTSQTSRGGGA